MLNKSTTKLNKTAVFCLFLYAIITLLRLFNHVPFFDEAHAWTISEQLNLFEVFKYTKNEGHFFLWQTMLYPFAKLHLYPYSMQILNWIFCTLAIILLWWKAPFNNVIKALITFSFPFLGCYSVISRCYALGIFLLFALASLYDKKLQYPKTYALLLVLCANTSVMALIGASAFGLMFLYDLIKQKSLNKKDYAIVSVILTVGVGLILYQVLFIDGFSTIVKNVPFLTTIQMFDSTYFSHNFILNSILNVTFTLIILSYVFRKKSSLFFIGFTNVLTLILGCCFYGLNFWHSYFFFIYLIIGFWLSADGKENLLKKVAYCVFGIISFILIFNSPVGTEFSNAYNSQAEEISSIIETDKNLNKSMIIHNDGVMYEILPYSSKKDYVIKNYCTVENNTDYNLFNSRYGDCVKGDIFGQAQKYPDIIKDIVLKNKNVYAFTQKNKNPQINNYGMIFAGGYNILIKKHKCVENICFWKVEIK